MSDVQKIAEIGYHCVWQEMPYGNHTLYRAVELIHSTSLLDCLARNEYASLSIGLRASQNIVDIFSARNYTTCNLCTIPLFGQISSGTWCHFGFNIVCCCRFEFVRLACVCAFHHQLYLNIKFAFKSIRKTSTFGGHYLYRMSVVRI